MLLRRSLRLLKVQSTFGLWKLKNAFLLSKMSLRRNINASGCLLGGDPFNIICGQGMVVAL
jgi:hypothetical protein